MNTCLSYTKIHPTKYIHGKRVIFNICHILSMYNTCGCGYTILIPLNNKNMSWENMTYI